MGRCYEFGAEIHAGCEFAMVVAAEGGRCECAGCGAVCPGRFNGCPSVTSKPGYSPKGAPVATEGVRTPEPIRASGVPEQPVLDRPAPSASLAAMNVPELAEVRSLLDELLERPDRAVEAVERLDHGLAVRDRELADAFERLTETYEKFIAELRSDREAREQVAAAVESLGERLRAVEQLLAERPSLRAFLGRPG